jgi:hypothetical protein
MPQTYRRPSHVYKSFQNPRRSTRASLRCSSAAGWCPREASKVRRLSATGALQIGPSYLPPPSRLLPICGFGDSWGQGIGDARDRGDFSSRWLLLEGVAACAGPSQARARTPPGSQGCDRGRVRGLTYPGTTERGEPEIEAAEAQTAHRSNVPPEPRLTRRPTGRIMDRSCATCASPPSGPFLLC